MTFSLSLQADVQLPLGAVMNGCPFIHNDNYDVGYLIDALKSQIATDLENKNKCQQTANMLLSNLAPLNDFYKSIDPAIREKITKSVYGNALNALSAKKIELERNGHTKTDEYLNTVSQIATIEEASMQNIIDLDSISAQNEQNIEAYYRNQINTYASNMLAAYTTALRNDPNCVDSLGGWEQTLAAVMGGFSMATGLGVNPSAQMIGAAANLGAQLVVLLKDSSKREAYNDLTKVQNYKTLACTYYSMKRASCEYKRAYTVAQDVKAIREFIRAQFSDGRKGEYERYFVNLGRINEIGRIFAIIAQMGSPLTLDREVLINYLVAKAVDFERVGTPPDENQSDLIIKSWLVRAKSYGVTFSEFNSMNGTPYTLKEQLGSAVEDIKNKNATIAAAEALMKANPSFHDLKRRLSSEFSNTRVHVKEMLSYLKSPKISSIIEDTDKETIDAAIVLLTKLTDFLNITSQQLAAVTGNDDLIVQKGSDIFQELARGSVAQLNRQSAIALGSKGTDRLFWAFGVIRNAYLTRDQLEKLPKDESFREYQKSRSVLSNVIDNYEIFSGIGTTFRNEDFAKTIESFEKSFHKDLIESMEFSMKNEKGLEELKGETARQLCALYYPSLKNLERKRPFLGSNKASRVLELCKKNYTNLPFNKLISDKDFTIDYKDECTYFEYKRELEIQNLLVKLIRY